VKITRRRRRITFKYIEKKLIELLHKRSSVLNYAMIRARDIKFRTTPLRSRTPTPLKLSRS